MISRRPVVEGPFKCTLGAECRAALLVASSLRDSDAFLFAASSGVVEVGMDPPDQVWLSVDAMFPWNAHPSRGDSGTAGTPGDSGVRLALQRESLRSGVPALAPCARCPSWLQWSGEYDGAGANGLARVCATPGVLKHFPIGIAVER